ncbi:MAG: hypothetical protein KC493_01345 [Bacteriovoracaceae bacterium]|nr:hypothetical protein [Bacteriovoracaceae bacterium]
MKILLSSLVLAFIFSSNAFALPYLSINGDIDTETLVQLNVEVESTSDNTLCKEARYVRGDIVHYPHVYTLNNWTTSNFNGYYSLDYSTDSRFEYKLMELTERGQLNLDGVDHISYKNLCQFRIKKLELSLGDSLLILTHSKDAKTDLVLELSKGTTRAFVFNFETISNFLWFKINVK